MQQILAASGSLAELAPVVARHARGPRIVIVCGPQSFGAIGGPALLRGLPGPWRLATAAGVLPRLEDYDTLHAEIGREGVDGLVAIGGGRVLDMAKLLSTGLPGAAEISRRLDAGEAIARRLPLVAVPTTAGSGSEATPFAVAYANGRKSSVDHPSLLPDAAIIDPSVLAGLPRAVVATAGLDALCHCIESLLSRRATPASRALARRGLKLGLANLAAAAAGRRAALARMSLTAHLAGRAIALTRTTIPHALSYPLTSRYGLAHGLAVSLSMATYLRLFGQRLATEPRLGDWGGRLWLRPRQPRMRFREHRRAGLDAACRRARPARDAGRMRSRPRRAPRGRRRGRHRPPEQRAPRSRRGRSRRAFRLNKVT